MTEFYPEGVSALGNESVIFVPALADQDAPTVAELTDAAAVNLSCALRGFSPTSEQASVQDVRLCTREAAETPGRVSNSIDDVTYVYDPQNLEDPDNAHYAALKSGTKGFLVDRRGLDARTEAIAAGQIVDVYPVEMGAQRRVAVDPGADGAKFEIVQKPFVTGPVSWDAVVGAGV